MGLGDVLMAAGLARSARAADPSHRPHAIRRDDGKVRWHPLWQGNPDISTDIEAPFIISGGRALPYLAAERARPGHYSYSTTYRARDHRTSIYLNDEEQALGADLIRRHGAYIVIEPTPRDRKNQNRNWEFWNFQRVVSQLRERTTLSLVQLLHTESNYLHDVEIVESRDIRRSAAYMASARLVLSLEGGIPFIAAALNTPAVVLWGGCVSAAVLGYPEQVNLVDADADSPCGSTRPCDHCTAAWARLTPDMVAAAVLDQLQRLEAAA